MKKLLSCLMAAALVALSVPPLRAGISTDAGCHGNGANELCVNADGDLIPETDDNADVGSSAKQFKDGWFDGVVYVDQLDLDGTAAFDGGTIVFNEDSGLYDVRIEGDTNTNLFLADGSTDRVGINDSSPDAALDINPNIAADTVLTVSGAASQVGNILHIKSNEDTEMLKIDADGGVSIVDGAATPTTAVDAGDLYIEEQLEVDGAVDLDLGLVVDGANVVINEDSGLFDFRVEGDTNANLLVVDGSADRVGVNVAAPGAALEINPNVASDTVLIVQGTTSQTADLVLVETAAGTDTLRILKNGGAMFRVYTESQVDALVPEKAGVMIQVSDFATSAITIPFALCINTDGVTGNYTLVGNTTTVGCDSGNSSD